MNDQAYECITDKIFAVMVKRCRGTHRIVDRSLDWPIETHEISASQDNVSYSISSDNMRRKE